MAGVSYGQVYLEIMHGRLVRVLVVLSVVCSACGGTGTESSGTAAETTSTSILMPGTSSSSPPASITPPTMTSAGTTTTLAVAATSGWETELGDLLVAGPDGVLLVRDSQVVAQPVAMAMERAVGDGTGGIIVSPPDPDGYPEYWPDPFGEGSNQLWRVTSDGHAEMIYEAPGRICLFDVFTDSASETWLLFSEERPVDLWMIDHLVAMPLADGDPVTLLQGISFEGGFSGAAWTGSHVIFSFEAEGMSWIEAVDLNGTPVEVPENPAPLERHSGYSRGPSPIAHVTVIPGSDLIAFIETAGGAIIDPPSYLVIFNLATGVEVAREPLPDVGRDFLRDFTRLDADTTIVAVSSVVLEEDPARWAHREVMVYDIESGTQTELGMVGVASVINAD